jgi:hypothetical protein
MPEKYGDPGNPILTVQINGVQILNVLVDLGAAINVITTETMHALGLRNLKHTPTVLELADRSTVKPVGKLEDVTISVDSWHYPIDFLVLQTQSSVGGHPLILGRPWLATADAYIGCRSGHMVISNGHNIKNLVLYPPAEPNPSIKPAGSKKILSRKESETENEELRPVLTIGQALQLKIESEDDVITSFMDDPCSISETNQQFLESILSCETQETIETTEGSEELPVDAPSESVPVELEPGKTLNINPTLSESQKKQLVDVLRKHKEAFTWDYTDMKGIPANSCTHHIYIKEDCRPVRQPQRRMNPALKNVVKEELQKLLDVGFIYPISDSQWVSPLVMVPKKNGKWRICVDYRELNKATQKDHFPLPFIDQVLDTLAGKKFFSFLDGFSGYNQIQIAPEDQDKTTFTCPWGTFAYRVLPFGLCNAPATFQREILGIFSDLIDDSVEIYMDDFTPYGDSFLEGLKNLEKVLERCIQARVSLSTEKCHMMMEEGIVLGHFLSAEGIWMDPAKTKVIQHFPTPKTPTQVRSFIGCAGYYRRFIENFAKVAHPLFQLLTKDSDFVWTEDCDAAFTRIKELVCSAPILRGPDWALPFHIHTDASQTAVGAVLGQQEDKIPYTVYYVSKNLAPAELNYTVTEKEFLAVIYAINKFWHYITGYPTFVHTDHAAIRYLMNKPVTPGRITRWLLLLQEFDITIVDKPGKDNVVADFLSRIEHEGKDTPIEDNFPDEHLFAVSANTLWYADIANYLASGKVPRHLSYKEKRKIIHQSTRYSWMAGYLFHTGADQQIRRCVAEDNIYEILKAAHDGPCGGHFADKRTGHKVLQMGYYWPSIFRDARDYV